MGMCEERFPDHIRDLFETLQGGILTYSEIQRVEIKEALVKFQIKEVYQGRVYHFSVVVPFFMMHLLLWQYSMIFWRYLLPE